MKKILIVENSPVIRKVVRAMLTRLGFAVSEAENGEVGLALCKQGEPDAVLVDWNMPLMDGITFVQELRRLPDGHLPKVFMCSIENAEDQIEHALSVGIDAYLTKPFNSEQLAKQLTESGLLGNEQ